MWLLFAILSSTPTPCDATLPTPPNVAPPDPSDWRGSVYDWAGGYDDAPLGVGHLKLDAREDIWDWWHRIEIPLYHGPDDEHWGWFVNGSLAPLSLPPEVVGSAGLVETGYETMTFIVLEHRNDGWLRFRYGKPSDGRDGTAWTHTCHVEAQGLRYESWEERFTSGEISVLTFRSDVPHVLRAGPDESADELHRIAGSHHLEPLEFRGDWLRVRVTEPSDYCAGEDIDVSVRKGWIRWRSTEKGPWIWYFTRGC